MNDVFIEKWATYYRYFYYYEDMTFERFINLVASGHIPQRAHVDWNKVGKFSEVETEDNNEAIFRLT